MSLRLTERQFNELVGNKGVQAKLLTSKRNKYRNRKIVVDGIRYDSTKEYERHMELKMLEKSGQISKLKFHEKSMTVILQDDPVIKYEPDFCYFENGIYVIEDLKGYQTKEFILKKKMLISKLKKHETDGKFRLTKQDGSKGFHVIEEYYFPDDTNQ